MDQHFVIPQNLTGGLIKLVGRRPKNPTIPLVKRDEEKILAKRQEEAEALGVEVGTVRPGVIDTGQHVVDNARLNLDGLLEQLEQNGFPVVDIHWEEIQDKKRPGQLKPVTVIAVSRIPAAPVPSDHLAEVRAELGRTYQYVHLWVNPKTDGTKNFTLNPAHVVPTSPSDGRLIVELEPSSTPVS